MEQVKWAEVSKSFLADQSDTEKLVVNSEKENSTNTAFDFK